MLIVLQKGKSGREEPLNIVKVIKQGGHKTEAALMPWQLSKPAKSKPESIPINASRLRS